MKVNYPAIVRAVAALLLGVLLIYLREEAVKVVVICVGLFFLLSAVGSLVTYFAARRRGVPGRNLYFQLWSGIGGLLLGGWLALSPSFFVDLAMLLLSLLLIALGTNQLLTLMQLRRTVPVPGGYYVVPLLVLLTGIFILFNPFEAAALPFLLVGIGSIVYAVDEVVNLIRFARRGDIPSAEEL